MIELPGQFQRWRELHNLTQSQAAERLGVSKRSIATYESTGPIPKTVALACEAITNEAQEVFEKLLKTQHPKLGENVLVLPFTIHRAAPYAEVVGINLTPEVQEWAHENDITTRFSMRTVITPEMRRREIAVVTFDSTEQAVYFKLRWC